MFTYGRQLLFSEQRDGKWRIVSVPVAGGTPSLVSGIEADMLLEDVASDGKSLLLRRVTPNQKELWIFRPSDRSLRLVGGSIDAATWSPFGDGMAISDETAVSFLKRGTRWQLFGLSGRKSLFLQWAPDGQVLRAWLQRKGDEPLTVWDFNLRQKETHEILGLCKNSDWTTRGMWTRDGRSFIYPSGNGLQTDLWMVKEDRIGDSKKRPVRLTSGPGSWLWPVRGPDDSTILALREETRSELVGFDPHDGVWKPMWDGFPASEIEYSRDGKWAAFVYVPNHFLWKSKSDGTGAIQLTSDKIVVHQPHWSPDGRTIAFMGQKPNGDWRIFVVPSSGGSVQELSPTQEDQGVPSWSADGQSIVFGELLARRKLEEMSLRLIDVASGKMRILEGTKGLWSPRWSPDGRYLLAVTTDSKRIRLLQTGTSTWTDLLSAIFVDNATWSYDSKFVYFDGQETVGKPDMFRVSVPEGRLEKLTKLQGFVPSHELWYGVAPDGTLLASRGFHSQEIFALKCVLP
ncbi:MAG: PD40 domain-containing protein [Acidobacteriaceae bacterium]|nr:PD40 domain-containing protein [Acidobacteriaceae bacterium]